jgi:predicted dehydrogenase
MKSRRGFITGVGKGVLGSIAISSAGFGKSRMGGQEDRNEAGEKQIRIGIIGAENSHTRGYGRMFNIDNKYPGIKVLYVWGETEEFARDAVERGGIPNMVKDPLEMMGKIDALIVDHRHPKYHLEAALPFVKAGIPTFIDKPFCYRVSEGKAFLELARKLKTPVSSYSTIAHRDTVFDLRSKIPSMGTIHHIVMYGAADIHSKYGGIFFYGVHMVQPLMYIFGDDVERVRVSRHGDKTSANLVFRSGYLATLVFVEHVNWGLSVITENGEQKLDFDLTDADHERPYSDMAEMFRTGKEPRSHDSILSCVAVLEALEKSVQSDRWEEVVV